MPKETKRNPNSKDASGTRKKMKNQPLSFIVLAQSYPLKLQGVYYVYRASF
jgi:hypothetical protein